ncbi:hypothetical protein LTR33_014806, partial [Friedmanniomyces endolithicus]
TAATSAPQPRAQKPCPKPLRSLCCLNNAIVSKSKSAPSAKPATKRRWRKEAEEAAALIARENASARPPPPPPAHTSPRKEAATPSGAKPAAQKVRQSSRSASPKKRDFSYQTGAPPEVLSTAYTGDTGTSGTRTASYYDEYRPRAVENPRYSSEQGVRGGGGRSRQSSPKKAAGRKAREGGYRRGADSDLD